jgi:hypothetical protein
MLTYNNNSYNNITVDINTKSEQEDRLFLLNKIFKFATQIFQTVKSFLCGFILLQVYQNP